MGIVMLAVYILYKSLYNISDRSLVDLTVKIFWVGMDSSSSRKRSAAIDLPNGWVREENERRNGISAGKSDVYYYRFV